MSRDERGTSIVEFAIILPVFVAVVFGMVNCGFLLWTQLGIEHAVVAASRCETINPTACPDIQTYATQQAYDLNLPKSTFTATTVSCGNQVTASYPFQFVTLITPAVNVTLTARSCYPT
ncbi:MAG TPA: TadE/TadG family type IV pilus assembly protein [Rhizomicrobium sp.]|jgi:Flp pilus assembly protein TadG|nr:TadE/TadG family type IV pilus assembly protein [Rhizomicrobium sp.]